MKLLLFTSPESGMERTARKEMVLHLAVKNNRFEAVIALVEHLKQNEKEQVINWKDHKGNTILHLAATVKNFKVVDFMLKYEAVEVNASNESGLMPLELSTLLQRGARDREITEILAQAGATHGKGRSNSPTSISFPADDNNIEGANSHQSDGEPVTNAPQSL
ncbi:ankyrin repeat-containing protein At2g01680-like [Eucalyptus grandis]|uniref:ankyrin repeat-containing protein At2g01680-like n=1 Tax=Eucalyptus grandis TaxID=71139 RepID=UPI00192EEEF9|nr:ankyrin repeat-containing protein At2g01680-like [Eucalyptus grandis]